MQKKAQEAVAYLRERLGLPPGKPLAVRTTVVPLQLGNSMACGYHTAWNYACVLQRVLEDGSTDFIQYGEQHMPLVHRLYVQLACVQGEVDAGRQETVLRSGRRASANQSHGFRRASHQVHCFC